MKGLLIKDLCLLKSQKKILPVYLLLAVWFTVMHNDGFGLPFLMMMASILMISTISYDELDHSNTHLFALPFDRKTYAQEKFVLGFILMAASLVLAGVCLAARMLFEQAPAGTDMGSLFIFSALAGAAIISVMVPVRIRFGGDQGRIVIFALFAVVVLGVLMITKLLPGAKEEAVGFLTRLGPQTVMLIVAGLVILLFVIGYLLAVRWIKRKEF